MSSTPQELDDEFEFFMRFVKPLVLSLPDSTDRVKAASWIQKLRKVRDANRNDYLKLLLFVLHRKELIGMFAENPEPGTKLDPLPEGMDLVALAHKLIEDSKEKGSGEPPPYHVEVSADQTEYVVAQAIPRFGTHVFYAVSKQPIAEWTNAQYGFYPKGPRNFAVNIFDTTSPSAAAVSGRGLPSPDDPENQLLPQILARPSCPGSEHGLKWLERVGQVEDNPVPTGICDTKPPEDWNAFKGQEEIEKHEKAFCEDLLKVKNALKHGRSYRSIRDDNDFNQTMDIINPARGPAARGSVKIVSTSETGIDITQGHSIITTDPDDHTVMELHKTMSIGTQDQVNLDFPEYESPSSQVYQTPSTPPPTSDDEDIYDFNEYPSQSPGMYSNPALDYEDMYDYNEYPSQSPGLYSPDPRLEDDGYGSPDMEDENPPYGSGNESYRPDELLEHFTPSGPVEHKSLHHKDENLERHVETYKWETHEQPDLTDVVNRQQAIETVIDLQQEMLRRGLITSPLAANENLSGSWNDTAGSQEYYPEMLELNYPPPRSLQSPGRCPGKARISVRKDLRRTSPSASTPRSSRLPARKWHVPSAFNPDTTDYSLAPDPSYGKSEVNLDFPEYQSPSSQVYQTPNTPPPTPDDELDYGNEGAAASFYEGQAGGGQQWYPDNVPSSPCPAAVKQERVSPAAVKQERVSQRCPGGKARISVRKDLRRFSPAASTPKSSRFPARKWHVPYAFNPDMTDYSRAPDPGYGESPVNLDFPEYQTPSSQVYQTPNTPPPTPDDEPGYGNEGAAASFYEGQAVGGQQWYPDNLPSSSCPAAVKQERVSPAAVKQERVSQRCPGGKARISVRKDLRRTSPWASTPRSSTLPARKWHVPSAFNPDTTDYSYAPDPSYGESPVNLDFPEYQTPSSQVYTTPNTPPPTPDDEPGYGNEGAAASFYEGQAVGGQQWYPDNVPSSPCPAAVKQERVSQAAVKQERVSQRCPGGKARISVRKDLRQTSPVASTPRSSRLPARKWHVPYAFNPDTTDYSYAPDPSYGEPQVNLDFPEYQSPSSQVYTTPNTPPPTPDDEPGYGNEGAAAPFYEEQAVGGQQGFPDNLPSSSCPAAVKPERVSERSLKSRKRYPGLAAVRKQLSFDDPESPESSRRQSTASPNLSGLSAHIPSTYTVAGSTQSPGRCPGSPRSSEKRRLSFRDSESRGSSRRQSSASPNSSGLSAPIPSGFNLDTTYSLPGPTVSPERCPGSPSSSEKRRLSFRDSESPGSSRLQSSASPYSSGLSAPIPSGLNLDTTYSLSGPTVFPERCPGSPRSSEERRLRDSESPGSSRRQSSASPYSSGFNEDTTPESPPSLLSHEELMEKYTPSGPVTHQSFDHEDNGVMQHVETFQWESNAQPDPPQAISSPKRRSKSPSAVCPGGRQPIGWDERTDPYTGETTIYPRLPPAWRVPSGYYLPEDEYIEHMTNRYEGYSPGYRSGSFRMPYEFDHRFYGPPISLYPGYNEDFVPNPNPITDTSPIHNAERGEIERGDFTFLDERQQRQSFDMDDQELLAENRRIFKKMRDPFFKGIITTAGPNIQPGPAIQAARDINQGKMDDEGMSRYLRQVKGEESWWPNSPPTPKYVPRQAAALAQQSESPRRPSTSPKRCSCSGDKKK